MKSQKSLISAGVFAVLVAACNGPQGEAVGPTEDSTAPAEKVSATNEAKVAALEEYEQPKTPEERRAMREKLAEWQARNRPAHDKAPAGQAMSTTGEVPDELLETIISDLMSKTAAARGDIEVLHTESLTWNDGSLGCGKPGDMYTKAPVPGYRVILGHAGEQFDYRATEKGFFMLCERPMLAAPGAGNEPPDQ